MAISVSQICKGVLWYSFRVSLWVVALIVVAIVAQCAGSVIG